MTFISGIWQRKTLIYISVACFLGIVLVTTLLLIFVKTDSIAKSPGHVGEASHWSYDDQGDWPGECQTGQKQSPIALTQADASKIEIVPIKLDKFSTCECMNVANNGHTVSVQTSELCPCENPHLSGGGLTQSYTFDNFHFHWPSEHTIDGDRYDLEGHFVFYADQYGSLDEALKYPYGVTVMAVLFKVNNYTTSDNFKIIDEAVKTVSEEAGQSVLTKNPVNFNEFLPYNHDIFFKYDGSLTTPNCTENVNWLVYQSNSNITYQDYLELSHIYDTDHKLLVATSRDIQDLNSRTVYIQSNTS